MQVKRWGFLGILTVIAVGCAAMPFLPDGWREGAREEGEKKRSWSGKNFLNETRVDTTPSSSAVAAGFDAERVWSGNDDWEPAIAADKNSQNVYQLTTRYGATDCPTCPVPSIAFRRSSDGGATWEPDKYFINSTIAQYDPLIEVAGDGTIFTAFMLNYLPGVMFSKSTDRGNTWTSPVSVAGRNRPQWGDKPALAVSRDGRDVYVAFNASNAYVVASHDGGFTWQAPIKTNTDRRYWFHYQGAVHEDGTVYFVAVDYSQSYAGQQHINIIRSTDQGRSWTTTRLDYSSESIECDWAPGCYFGFFGSSVGMAVDAAGKVLVAYSANNTDGVPAQLFVKTSSDGINWSARKQISVDDASVINGFPVVAAGPTPGDFRVVWQDDRTSSQTAFNAWYKRTVDGGVTWSEDVRLSDQSDGAPYKSALGYGFPYGDYYEIAVDGDGTNHIIWGEGTSYDGPGGTWFTRGL